MGRAPGAVVSARESARSGWDAWLDDVAGHAQRLVDSAIDLDSGALLESLHALRHLHDDPRGLPAARGVEPPPGDRADINLRTSPSAPMPPPVASDIDLGPSPLVEPTPPAASSADLRAPSPPASEPVAVAPAGYDEPPPAPPASPVDPQTAEPGLDATVPAGVPVVDLAALAAEPHGDPAESLTLPIDVLDAPLDLVEAKPEGPSGGGRAARRIVSLPGVGDRVFRTGSTLAGLAVLGLMAAVGLLLLFRAFQALRVAKFSFLTTAAWEPGAHHFGIAAILSGTVLIALVAMVVAVPFAIGTALFISEVAPRRIKGALVSVVDLMAAVPSVVYGIWGFFYFQGHVLGLSRWISTWFSWIPIFRVNGAQPTNPLANQSVYTASTFIAGLVVAMMAMPIACSVMREVFSQAPLGEREGAYALGATRWGMIRTVVLPFGRGGMIGGAMLGLGRALGETIAVVMIISPLFKINFHILQVGSNSVASLIALRYGDASKFGLSALMAAGLSLFVLTLFVNFGAATIVARSRSGAGTEA